MATNAGRPQAEKFAVMVAQNLADHCAVIMLLPWSTGVAPQGVLAPAAEDTAFTPQEITDTIRDRVTVILPVTYELAAEEVGARRVLPLLSGFENISVFMAHIVPEESGLTRELNETIMRRHEAMLATGTDDVLMDPELDPQATLRAINLARSTWELNVRRMQLMLDAEPELVLPEVLQQLQQHHRRLLWESVPRALMPHLRTMDRHLVETGDRIDRYVLHSRFDTVVGKVLQAASENSKPCVVKVIEKSSVFTPGELEGIYREYRFLSEIIRHPNIVKCMTMLHSSSRVYLIFEHAGSQNLKQALWEEPGQRFDEEDTFHCFIQLVKALAHCHDKHVAHRSVSLEHLCVNKLSGTESYQVQLCDFRSAMVARGGATSKTPCGSLPCMAPELALGIPYWPSVADCWSAGVVLLETAGGLSSFGRSLEFDPAQVDPSQVAAGVQQFFSQPGSHARALAKVGGVERQSILTILQSLMIPNPSARAPIHDFLPNGAND